MADTEVLHVDQLLVRFSGHSKPAVDGVSFSLDRGDTLAIVGESGSGKSTTAMATVRLLPESARVRSEALRFEGVELSGLGRSELRALRGRKMGFVFQDPLGSWNPARRIGAQLLDGMSVASVPGDHRARLEALFDRVGIVDPGRRLDDYPHELSGGMLQRAMIAGAVAADPSLLFADEPTSALDATVQQEILSLLAELQCEIGMAIVLISHDLWVVRRASERVLVLYGGQVVEQGYTPGVLEHPIHPYTQGLVASAPGHGATPRTRLPTMPPGPVHPVGCPFATRCPLVTSHCREERPQFSTVDTRVVACHEAERAAGVWTR